MSQHVRDTGWFCWTSSRRRWIGDSPRFRKNLDREVAKNKLSTSEKSEAISRITLTTDVSRLAESDFIIEAVVEDFES